MTNRVVMINNTLEALRDVLKIPFEAQLEAVNCHHNYISRERHYDKNVIVTRKGVVSAKLSQMGIITGSMGAKSFIVRGFRQ